MTGLDLVRRAYPILFLCSALSACGTPSDDAPESFPADSGGGGGSVTDSGDAPSADAGDEVTMDADQEGDVEADGATTATMLSLGAQKSCRKDAFGVIACWGRNQHGELGLGTTGDGTNKSRPEPIGTDTDWQTISPGGFHVCATKTSGALLCWGLNSSGQVGDGSGVDRSFPVLVGTTSDWVQVATGGYHTCGLREDGSLWCWGWNSFGALGMGTQGEGTEAFEPVAVAAGRRFHTVAAGDYHSCAISEDGSLWCWGANAQGQIGNDTLSDVLTPVRVGGFADWVAVSAGQYHTCGLRDGGSLWCWGANDKGQCGQPEPTVAAEPLEVPGAFVSVSAGQKHTCAIGTNNSLWCFGFNDSGQLGVGSNVDTTEPTHVEPGTTWRSVAAGDLHTCGEMSDAKVYCWGWNYFGQLGNGTVSNDSTNWIPTAVE